MEVGLPPLRGRVYVDTAPLVYTIESHQPYFDLLTPFWEDEASHLCVAVSSAITLAEALIVPMRKGDLALQAYDRQTLEGSRLDLRSVSNDVLVQAAAVRATYRGVRMPDAIHGATAHLSECATFLSNDRKLAWIERLYGIRFIYLNSLIHR